MYFAHTILAAAFMAVAVPAGVRSDATRAGCDNGTLLGHSALLVVVPHPDDGVLGFGGLLRAYLKAGKPTTLVVVTNGDGACGACRFWTNAGRDGPACSSADLVSFGQARVEETREATAILGHPQLQFLGYPDRGIATALNDVSAGHPEVVLSLRDCRPNHAGPPTNRTAGGLVQSLHQILAATAPDTLIATAEPLAGHPDHAALGQLLAAANAGLTSPRTLIFGLIHTPPADGTECTYPPPAAADCACRTRPPGYFLSKPGLLDQLRAARYQPGRRASTPLHLPKDPLQYCEPPEMWQGPTPLELQAIDRFQTQLGTSSRDGTPVPAAERGWSDCTGYLTAFVKPVEFFWPASTFANVSASRLAQHPSSSSGSR